MALAGPPRSHVNGAAAEAIFTPVRGSSILRTSPIRSSRKLGCLADVPIRKDSLLSPVSCVPGWGDFILSSSTSAKEGDRVEKDRCVAIVDGGSSCFCQRGCTGVAFGEARQDSDGQRD